MSAAAAGFWRSVLVVLTGSAAAQAIPLLGSLVIARLFSPAQYGQFATWLGVVAVGAVVITGRYEMTLAIERDGEPRRVAARATLLVVLCGGALLTVASVLAGLLGIAGAIEPLLLWATGPAAAAVAASQTWQSWAAADGNYRDLSIIRIVQAGAVTAAQILAGLLDAPASGLALAHLGGVAAGTLLASRRLPLGRASAAHDAVPGALDFLRRQRRFPMLALPADSVNTAAAQLPLVIVAHRFGADVAGLLALTLRIVGAPIGLLGASVLDVFRRRSAASYVERGECRTEYVDTFRMLALGSGVVAVTLALVAEPAFALAFGDTWLMSGTMAAWLMPMFALRFMASPLSYMFYVAGKQHLDLAWQLALLATTVASLWLPRSPETAVQVYGAGYAVLYCIYLALTYRLSKGTHS